MARRAGPESRVAVRAEVETGHPAERRRPGRRLDRREGERAAAVAGQERPPSRWAGHRVREGARPGRKNLAFRCRARNFG